ncbi:MAG: InlB B-repeat-containing protein [Lachnospiraceae bacterium]|nr:InlB B-repeat-containing protein [Lachnospiraceae bacterium]
MKKTVSLMLAFLLSMTVFVSDVIGLTMVARAEEIVSDESVPSDEGDPGDPSTMSNQSAEWDAQIDEMIRQQQEADAGRQQAMDEAANDAEEAAKQQEDDEAAQEAKRKAEEEEQKRQQEAEEAEKAAEEARKAEEDKKYSLTATLQSSQIGVVTYLDFGSAQIGTDRDYFPLNISNTGNNAVDIIMAETMDADGAFSATLHGDKTYLEPGETSRFNVSMKSSLQAGTYTAYLLFADKNRDPNFVNCLKIPLRGVVTPKQAAVTGVTVTPSKATLAVGNSYQFYANVTGTGDFNQGVNWTITNQQSSGTYISNTGNLTIAADETSPAISIIATSTANAQAAGYATVTPQRNSYNVSANVDPVGGGSISGGGAVSQGGSVTLSAVPAKNFYFVGWIRDGQIVSNSTNYTVSNVQSNVGVTAKFAQTYVTVKAEANNTNGGNVVGGGTITYGGSTTLSAKAYSGYVFTGWKEGDNVISRDASIKLNNLTVDRKITAVFEKTSHTVVLNSYPAEGGKTEGGGTFAVGQGTTIKATPASGYKFVSWNINNQVVSREATCKIDKVEYDCTVTAVFEKEGITAFEISSGVATTGGTISPSGKVNVAKGTNVTYTITPKSGFAILAVAVDGIQVGPVSTYTFTNVQAPHTISAAFVQTNAGQQAAAQSGKPVQTQKVEPVAKTTTNTATTESTVSISEAASGEAGDTYVEEMPDLENIAVPTDEELGVPEDDFSQQSYSEVTQMLGMSMNEVEAMVMSGNRMPVLDAAFYTGALGAYVTNDYEPSEMKSVDYQNMSREELMLVSDDEINPSLPDLDVVVERMLSTDEVMSMAKGGQVGVSVSLTKVADPDAVTQRIMKNAVGQKPVEYFDLTMLKTTGGFTEKVTELPTTMEVVVEIPEAVYQSGKTYSVLRIHNGELTVLPDLDDNPRTITFRTDRFSSYAIAKEVASSRSLVGWLAGGAIVAFGIAATCFIILIAHQANYRKARRKAKAK